MIDVSRETALPVRGDSLRRWLRAFSDALIDPSRAERTVLWALVGYTLLWTVYGVIAHSSRDIHWDMAEALVWSREALLGSPKHPPLSGWVAGLWFSVFPQADWAFYLLSMTMTSIGLWFAWRLTRRYLSAEKRVVGFAVLTLVPFFNIHALKYNANSVTIPLWGFATWAFVRSFDTHKNVYAVLAGIAAALAMYGKYWTVFLLAALAIVAIADRKRVAYFRSPAPWITVAVGAVVLAPHVIWLAHHDFSTLTYAMESHRSAVWRYLASGPNYLIGLLAYLLAPVAIVSIAAKASREIVADVLLPGEPDRRRIMLAFALPVLLPVIATVLTASAADYTWAMASLTLLPIVLMSSPMVHISRRSLMRIVGMACAFPVLMIVISPVIAVMWFSSPRNHIHHYKMLAAEIDHIWDTTSDEPLGLVGGNGYIANGSAFYVAEKPATYDVLKPEVTPWVNGLRIAREGMAWVCPIVDKPCVDAVQIEAERLPPGERVTVTLQRQYLLWRSRPQTYLIITSPPQIDAAEENTLSPERRK